jgi:hypothetical protein
MIKAWLIAVVMTNNIDVYVFEKPSFDTAPQCIEWVNMNPQAWVPPVMEAFPNGSIDMVYCVKKEKILELIPEFDKKHEKGNYIEHD